MEAALQLSAVNEVKTDHQHTTTAAHTCRQTTRRVFEKEHIPSEMS